MTSSDNDRASFGRAGCRPGKDLGTWTCAAEQKRITILVHTTEVPIIYVYGFLTFYIIKNDPAISATTNALKILLFVITAELSSIEISNDSNVGS